MEAKTESPASAAIAVLYDGRATEVLVTYAEADGGLHTLQFRETRADIGEVEMLLDYDWQRKAPPGAIVLIPESGHSLVKLDEYWLMWRDGQMLMGQAVSRPEPVASVTEAGERLIDRPIVAPNQQLHAYAWRGKTLVRHRFPARNEGGEATVETLWEAPTQPTRALCSPVPGDEAGKVMIGYLNDTESGLEASAVYVCDDKVTPVLGKSTGRYRLRARNRMGMHVGIKARPELAVVAESYEDGGYVLLEAKFDMAKGECQFHRTNIEGVPKDHMQSSATYYYKTQDTPEAFTLAVGKAGHLISPKRRNVQIIRHNVGGEYGYPVLTTLAGRYAATGTGAGVKLVTF